MVLVGAMGDGGRRKQWAIILLEKRITSLYKIEKSMVS